MHGGIAFVAEALHARELERMSVGTVSAEGCVTLPGHLYQAANIASEAEMLAMTPDQLKAANIPIAARIYLSEVRAFENHVGVHGLFIIFCVWIRPGVWARARASAARVRLLWPACTPDSLRHAEARGFRI